MNEKCMDFLGTDSNITIEEVGRICITPQTNYFTECIIGLLPCAACEYTHAKKSLSLVFIFALK